MSLYLHTSIIGGPIRFRIIIVVNQIFCSCYRIVEHIKKKKNYNVLNEVLRQHKLFGFCSDTWEISTELIFMLKSHFIILF